MKKLYFLLLALCLFTSANAQIINIPDANFKAKLLAASPNYYIAKNLSGSYFKIDVNNDGEIQLSEALEVSYLKVDAAGILSLNGIANFTNLKHLECQNNQLTSLDLINLINLEYLRCDTNYLNNLNVSGLIHLTHLLCNNNQLINIDFSGLISITHMICSNNQFTNLNLTGLANLINLSCDYNSQLTNLSVNGLSNLEYLYCSNNVELTTLNVSGLVNLQHFYFNNNSKLTSVDITGLNNLIRLECHDNRLTSLNCNGLTNLEVIICNNNELTSINLDGLVSLSALYVNDNLLTSLNLDDLVSLDNIYCYNNQLTSLYMKNGRYQLPFLNNNPNLVFICADDSEIEDVQYILNTLNYFNCQINSTCSIGLVKMYPNPVSDILKIVTNENEKINSINIYNTFGKLILIIPNAQNIKTVDVSNLSSGNYFIKINSDKGTSNTKFIKQ